jgi:ribosomal protein L33
MQEKQESILHTYRLQSIYELRMTLRLAVFGPCLVCDSTLVYQNAHGIMWWVGTNYSTRKNKKNPAMRAFLVLEIGPAGE